MPDARWISFQKLSEILSSVQWISFSFSVSWRAISPRCFPWWLVICRVMMWCQNVMRMNDCAEWATETRSGYQVHQGSVSGFIPLASPAPAPAGADPALAHGSVLMRNVPPGRTSEKYHCRFDSKLHKYPETITSFSFHLQWMKSKNSMIFFDLKLFYYYFDVTSYSASLVGNCCASRADSVWKLGLNNEMSCSDSNSSARIFECALWCLVTNDLRLMDKKGKRTQSFAFNPARRRWHKNLEATQTA